MKRHLLASGYTLSMLLSLAFVLTLLSANYQVPRDPRCYGHLSGGFPLAFLCDDDAGSPTSSWGTLDEVDWYGGFVLFSPAFILDVACYAVLLGISWLLIRTIARRRRQRSPAP